MAICQPSVLTPARYTPSTPSALKTEYTHEFLKTLRSRLRGKFGTQPFLQCRDDFKMPEYFRETYVANEQVCEAIWLITVGHPSGKLPYRYEMSGMRSNNAFTIAPTTYGDPDPVEIVPYFIRNPFDAWLLTLMCLFDLEHKYLVVGLTGSHDLEYNGMKRLHLRHTMQAVKDGKTLNKQVEFLTICCYSEDQARADNAKYFEEREEQEIKNITQPHERTESPTKQTITDTSEGTKVDDTSGDGDDSDVPIILTPTTPNHLSGLDSGSGERKNTLFSPGERHLAEYLHMLDSGEGMEQQPVPGIPAANFWGAVAVGRHIKFYRWVREDHGMAMYTEDPGLHGLDFAGARAEINGSKEFDVEWDARTIEEILMLMDEGRWA